MCIIPDKKTDRRPGRGYKVVEKDRNGDYWSLENSRYKYNFSNGWLQDTNDNIISYGDYKTGFHVSLDLDRCQYTKKLFDVVAKNVIIEVSFREVTSSTNTDWLYGRVRVARQIKFRREMEGIMTKRCKHKHLMTKPDYPDDIICEDCQTIFRISEYMNWSAKDLMHHAPPFIRQAVLKRQAEQFTGAEVEHLLDKASQPLEPERKPALKEAETSELPTSGDCSENHTRSDNPEGT